jgi:hypothetical protein
MELFAQALPALCDALAAALIRGGRRDLAKQCASIEIGRVNFDDSIGASYVHLGLGESAHGETVRLDGLLSLAVDVDSSGTLEGVEIFAAPEPLKAELRRRVAF